MKILKTIELNKTVAAVLYINDICTIKFTDATVLTMASSHSQDCCEKVYADFSPLLYFAKQLEQLCLIRLVLKRVLKEGFLLVFESSDTTYKVFIPCYNIQNGYYSNDLALVIEQPAAPAETLDISGLTECLYF